MDFINKVPDEILVRFFDEHSTLDELSNCALVSRRWYAVAQDHPTFWSSTELGPRHGLHLFLKRLNRRSGLPIRVKARAVSYHDHVRGFEAIAENMHRITDLDIHTQHEDWVLYHGSRALAVPAHILSKLCIAVESGSRSCGIVAPPRSLFAGSAPHLTSVSLKDTTFLFGDLGSLSLPSVTHASVMYTGVYDTVHRSAHGNDSETHWRIPLDLLDHVVSIFPHLQSLRLSIRPQWSRANPDSSCRRYPATHPSKRTRDALTRIQFLDANWCAAAWPVLRYFDLESMAVIRLRVGRGGADIAATCALPVSHCALVGLASASVKGASDDEGIVELASLDGRLTRIVIAPVEECWDRPVLGALLAAQFWHLTTLSVVHLAWDGILSCGLTALPSLRVLRMEFPELTHWQAPRSFAQASAEIAYLHCPALQALMLESERSITITTETLEGFLRDLDAPTDRLMLTLRRVEIWDAQPPEERTQFARIVVGDTSIGEHADWLARADSLLGSSH